LYLTTLVLELDTISTVLDIAIQVSGVSAFIREEVTAKQPLAVARHRCKADAFARRKRMQSGMNE